MSFVTVNRLEIGVAIGSCRYLMGHRLNAPRRRGATALCAWRVCSESRPSIMKRGPVESDLVWPAFARYLVVGRLNSSGEEEAIADKFGDSSEGHFQEMRPFIMLGKR